MLVDNEMHVDEHLLPPTPVVEVIELVLPFHVSVQLCVCVCRSGPLVGWSIGAKGLLAKGLYSHYETQEVHQCSGFLIQI